VKRDDDVAAAGGEAALQGGALAADRLEHDLDLGAEPLRDLERVVGRAAVHQHDLVRVGR
jgi:hypothetical protein